MCMCETESKGMLPLVRVKVHGYLCASVCDSKWHK